MSRALVMATRVDAAGLNPPEAEPVIVDTDDPAVVVLVLDDGERLELDPGQLSAALEAA